MSTSLTGAGMGSTGSSEEEVSVESVVEEVWSCCVYYDVSASEEAVVESDELVSEVVVY